MESSRKISTDIVAPADTPTTGDTPVWTWHRSVLRRCVVGFNGLPQLDRAELATLERQHRQEVPPLDLEILLDDLPPTRLDRLLVLTLGGWLGHAEEVEDLGVQLGARRIFGPLIGRHRRLVRSEERRGGEEGGCR